MTDADRADTRRPAKRWPAPPQYSGTSGLAYSATQPLPKGRRQDASTPAERVRAARAARAAAAQEAEQYRQECIGTALRECAERGVPMTYRPRR